MEEKQITPVFSGNVQGSYTDQITKIRLVTKIVWGCCFVLDSCTFLRVVGFWVQTPMSAAG